MKPSTNSFKKRPSGSLTCRWKKGVIVGATLAATLNVGLASALDFTFTFSGQGSPTDPATVTGIISGLVDNTDNQTTGITAAILTETNVPSGSGAWGLFADANYLGGTGLTSLGAIAGVDIRWFINSHFSIFALGNQNVISPRLYDLGQSGAIDPNSSSQNHLRFAPVPVPSVPGPWPFFGAAAAFGWSRRLRRRCRTTA